MRKSAPPTTILTRQLFSPRRPDGRKCTSRPACNLARVSAEPLQSADVPVSRGNTPCKCADGPVSHGNTTCKCERAAVAGAPRRTQSARLASGSAWSALASWTEMWSGIPRRTRASAPSPLRQSARGAGEVAADAGVRLSLCASEVERCRGFGKPCVLARHFSVDQGPDRRDRRPPFENPSLEKTTIVLGSLCRSLRSPFGPLQVLGNPPLQVPWKPLTALGRPWSRLGPLGALGSHWNPLAGQGCAFPCGQVRHPCTDTNNTSTQSSPIPAKVGPPRQAERKPPLP